MDKLLLLSTLFLFGCSDGYFCKWDYDRELQIKLYRECLTLAAQARTGQSYTTNDDEDFDEVIEQCSFSAKHQALLEEVICGQEDERAISGEGNAE